MSDKKEAVIVGAVRTPVGRANKGAFINTRIDDLGALIINEALKNVKGLDPKDVEDVYVGCAMPEGEQGMNVGRMIVLLSNLPDTCGAATVNRFCASGLEVINLAAMNIMAGNGDVYIAAGVETMTHVPMGGFSPSLNPKLCKGEGNGRYNAYISMGITAENVAKKYKVTREDQDKFAFNSHQKAVKAQKEGKFTAIIPVELGKDGDKVKLEKDENPRADSNLEKLATLKPAFLVGGTVTAGNSSPLTDGAAAIVLMSAEKAKKLGVKPIARIKAMAVTGLDPEYMGMGPYYAVNKVLKRAGMKISDVDYFEMNEAFAAQAVACQKELKVPDEKLNVHGGAIAIGHPLGCTGTRIMADLLGTLKAYKKSIGVETMCIGGGQGAAVIVEMLN